MKRTSKQDEKPQVMHRRVKGTAGVTTALMASSSLAFNGCEERPVFEPVVPSALHLPCPVAAPFGGGDARALANASALNGVWSPGTGSAWLPYHKATLLSTITWLGDDVQPCDTDRMAEWTIAEAFFKGDPPGPDTAIFIDLAGPESVTWAAAAAQILGGQPVIGFNNWPHQRGVVPVQDALSALLYFGPEVQRLRASGRIKDDAPPVFVLDAQRLGVYNGAEPGPVSDDDFDNRYFHVAADFPKADDLKQKGIAHALYLCPRDDPDEADDLNDYFADLTDAGVEVHVLPVGRPVRRNHTLSEHTQLASSVRTGVHSHRARWMMMRSIIRRRPTVFAGTVRSSGPAGFMRTSGGGFGGSRGISSGGSFS